MMGTCLIPVATKESSVDVEKNGFLIPDFEIDTLQNLLSKINDIDTNTLKSLSEKNYAHIKNKHTQKIFKEEFSSSIDDILNKQRETHG